MTFRKNLRPSHSHCLRILFVAVGILASAVLCAQQPNIVIIDIDDMGCCDFGAYGSTHSQTPNINELALQGTRFTQFYSGAPICSPSRAAMFTGQYAARSGITSFIDGTAENFSRDMPNSLSLSAPSIARTFHTAGYATGHFGKWHLGGGRDVGYLVNPDAGTTAGAPRIVEYGYHDAWTQMEGLGNRIINVEDYAGANANGVPDSQPRPSNYLNGLNQSSYSRGTGGGLDERVYLAREFNGTFMINKAIQFIDAKCAADPNQPFFLNVWLDETHTPHDPPAALRTKYNNLYPSLPQETRDYLAVLEHTDQQIGRLIDHIDQLGLGDDTLILVTSDNGAVDVNANNINSTGPFRGTKGDLFEGGFRQPLIARWTGNVAANRTDTETVIWGPDLFPTLTQIAGIDTAGVDFDGENLSDALRGVQSQTRSSSLFWNINRGQGGNHTNPNSSGAGANNQEVIAIRTGKWKLLINAQGTAPELYDLSVDVGETNNLALQQPGVVQSMASEALDIRYHTPSRILPDAVTATVRLKANDLTAIQGDGSAVSSWVDSAAGGFNGSVSQGAAANRPTLRTGLNGLNGRAVVSFDGNDHLQSSITNSLPSAGQGITVFAVATGDSTGNTAQRLGQIGDDGGAAGRVAGLEVSTAPTSTSNGGAGFRYNNGSSLYDTPLDSQDFHIVVWQIDNNQAYADAKLYVDGTVLANTFTGSGGTSTVNFSGNDLELLLGTGRLNTGAIATSDYFNGQLAEFLVFNEQLSVGQINLVANYLSTEYDLPFAYETNLSLFATVEGLAWNGGTANFSSAWNAGNGAGGPAGSTTNPFSGGTQDLYLGNNGVAVFDNSTDTLAGSSVNTLRIGTAQAGFIISGTGGNGTLTASGSKSLTIGNGSQPVGGAETGDLIVGADGSNGTVNWGSTGTLKVEGKLRIGEGGTGTVTQNSGTITAGDVAGSLKFIAIGSGVGSTGTYNLNNGRFLPGGGISGTELRHVRIGFNGATGVLNIGDGVGAAASASLESRDDLYVGYDGGSATLTLKSDGRILLSGNNAPVFIGYNAGSNGMVTQTGGTFTSNADFTIGEAGGVGVYEISGGTLHTADDTAGAFRVGRNGGKGTLRVAGNSTVVQEDTLTLADGATGTEGAIELIGSNASLTIARLENLALGASETMRWVADANGVTPLVVNGTSETDDVQLQDTAELSTNGIGNGTALSLDLSAITGNHTLTLIENEASDVVTGLFEDGNSMNLFEEGEQILGTGFQGSVTISYSGGTGDDVTLSLVALPGDYNGDLIVDTLDYVVWRQSNIHGQQGHADWSANYGSDLSGAGAGQAGSGVPEPASWLMLVMGVVGLGLGLGCPRSRCRSVVLHG